MEIAENALYYGGRLTLKGVSDAEEILRRKGIEARKEGDDITIHAESIQEALEIYRNAVRALLHTEHLEKFGFSFREIFGYGFLIYLKEYREGMEDALLKHPLRQDFDIVTLPNREGYYYSTLYGIDNLNVSAILALGNLFARELMEILENNPSLMELIELKKISGVRLERFDSGLSKLVRSLERVERIEEIVKKMLAVRFAFSNEIAVAGNVEHAEVQKIRRLGNGLCIYLSRKMKRLLGVKENDAVAVRFVSGKVLVEKI